MNHTSAGLSLDVLNKTLNMYVYVYEPNEQCFISDYFTQRYSKSDPRYILSLSLKQF